MNISDEINRLHELHQAGALTAAEFEAAKAKLLSASVDLNKPALRSSNAEIARRLAIAWQMSVF